MPVLPLRVQCAPKLAHMLLVLVQILPFTPSLSCPDRREGLRELGVCVKDGAHILAPYGEITNLINMVYAPFYGTRYTPKLARPEAAYGT